MSSIQEEIFFEIHSGLPREAPGSPEATQRAYQTLPEPGQIHRIADIGCGPGAQSLQLAELSEAEIHAVDFHQPYIESLKQAAQEKKLEDRIFPLKADMNELPFDEHSFDLIWSEGAIYIMGMEKGLRSWRQFLRPGGYLVVSEITWLAMQAPERIQQFWNNEYPAIKTIGENIEILQKTGYTVLDTFILPPEAWWEGYYNPLEQRIENLKEKYQDVPEALQILTMEEREIDLFRRYGDYYSYVFYIAQLSDKT